VRGLLPWSLALLVGCAFETGWGPSGGGSSGSGGGGGNTAPDASVTVDAKPAPDAACPDDDQDGVCNAVDDWPCGAKPTGPSAMLTINNNGGATVTKITSVNLDATGQLATGTSQEQLSLRFNYDIQDTACAQACVDQIEVGWVSGSRSGCVFDQVVDKNNGAQGAINTMIRAPTNKGAYDLRVNLGQNYSCTYQGANSWWDQTAGGPIPDGTRTIAKLCVR